jgi:hypothetical protein
MEVFMDIISKIHSEYDNNIEETVRSIYKNKIKLPVFIKSVKNMSTSYGLYGLCHIDDYMRGPNKMPDHFYNKILFDMHDETNNRDGYFHHITVSECILNTKRKTSKEWDYSTYKKITNNPTMYWLTNILTHELHHAWQHDKVIVRTKNKSIKILDNIDKMWYINIYEFDAEVEANKLRVDFIKKLIGD